MKGKGTKQETKEDTKILTLKDVKKVSIVLQFPLTKWFNSHSLLRKIANIELVPDGTLPYFDTDLPDTKVYYYNENKVLQKSTADRTCIGVFELKTKNEERRLNSRGSHYEVIQDVKCELAERMLFEENMLLKRFLHDCCRAEKHYKHYKSSGFIRVLYDKFMEENKDKTHYFIITKDLKDAVEKKENIKMDPNIVTVLDSFEQFCCILSHNSLWVPCYALSEMFPCGKEIEELEFLHLMVYSLLGISLDTSSCRFYTV